MGIVFTVVCVPCPRTGPSDKLLKFRVGIAFRQSEGSGLALVMVTLSTPKVSLEFGNAMAGPLGRVRYGIKEICVAPFAMLPPATLRTNGCLPGMLAGAD